MSDWEQLILDESIARQWTIDETVVYRLRALLKDKDYEYFRELITKAGKALEEKELCQTV